MIVGHPVVPKPGVKLPNFLYIGPNKAGSTWIYEALRRHPEVFLSPAKELHYFDLYYSLGARWYARHFKAAEPQHRIIGEISHDYLYSADACERIASDLDDAHLMVCLREPVERTFSAYLYLIKQGYVRSSFEEAFKSHPSILQHGLYAVNLIRYRAKFGMDALILTTFDDLKADPVAYYLNLCKRLNIGQNVPHGFPTGKVLAAAEPRNWLVARLVKEAAMAMRRMGLADTITRVKSQHWLQHLLYRPYASNQQPAMEPGTRDMLRRYFMQDVVLLDHEFLPGIARLWGYR